MRKISLLILLFALTTPNGFAQVLDKEYKAWSVFSVKQDGEKICYITSSPSKKKGNYKNRKEPYLLVTYRGKGISEVSVSSGYPYKNKSNVEIIVSKKKFKLFTSLDTPKMAWAKSVADDKKIIHAMKKGANLSAKGYSKIGTYSKDTYSLMGFTGAYNRMQKLCK